MNWRNCGFQIILTFFACQNLFRIVIWNRYYPHSTQCLNIAHWYFLCKFTGTGGRPSPATALKLLNLQRFKSEICPSPQPSPTLSRAYKETSLVLAEASPIPPRAERVMLIQNNFKGTGEKKQGKK